MKQVNQWEGTILSHYLKLMLSEFGLLNLQTITKGFSHSSVGQESACNAGDPSWIPGCWRSPGEEKGYPFQYSGLENSKDYIVHGVAESHTTERLSLTDWLYVSIFIYISIPISQFFPPPPPISSLGIHMFKELEFFELYQTQEYHQLVLKTLSASSCRLQTDGN